MILCQQAFQSINLNYSVIKFLRYEGIIWQGNSLPFSAHRLGELMHAEISLISQKGERQSGLSWDQGNIHGHFSSEEVYDLVLRLEYRAPFFLDEIRADFEWIHPYQYEISIDFTDALFTHADPRIRVGIGNFARVMEPSPLEERAPEGQHISLAREGQHLGLMVRHRSTIPFGHTHFPRIALNESARIKASP